MSVAFLFPGQGSQVPGMLHALPSGHVLNQLGREAFLGVRTLAVGETSFKHALLLAVNSG